MYQCKDCGIHSNELMFISEDGYVCDHCGGEVSNPVDDRENEAHERADRDREER